MTIIIINVYIDQLPDKISMKSEYIFIIVWIGLVIVSFIVFYILGKKTLSIFPELNNDQITFRVKGVTGNSDRSALTYLGGAKNVLDVIITIHELWVKTPLIFARFTKFFDLLHKVPSKDIYVLKINDRFLSVTFRTNSINPTTLNLRIRKKSLKHFLPKL
ncbi:hypothetical protein [Nonlabens sp.]|uniref:hypothetical protein n=1 Tax=Nonlabens sp. TaxID=1888209 RepID=UPI003F699D9A